MEKEIEEAWEKARDSLRDAIEKLSSSGEWENPFELEDHIKESVNYEVKAFISQYVKHATNF